MKTLIGSLLALLVAPACAASALDALAGIAPKSRIVRTIDDNARVTLADQRHPRAIPADDQGRVDDGLRLERMILVLNPESAAQGAALDAFLAAARDPSSAAYGQWLTAQDFARHFGASPADIDKVGQWLRGHGFVVDEMPAGGRAIVFSGTAGQVRAAFHTEIHHYRRAGEHHLANAGDPQIPEALAAVVSGIVSLHDFHSRPLHVRLVPAPGYTTGSTHYLAAGDFHTIYNVKPLLAQSIDGSGRSIAILGRSNVVLADVQHFRSAMKLAANSPQVIVNGSDPGLVSGDQGESDLDLEWAGAVAPAATIKFVTSASTSTSDGIDLSAQYAVSNNVADIISLSYGQCEKNLGKAGRDFFNNLWKQAAAQGMTVVVSSGDSGAAGCDSPSAGTGTVAAVNGLCSSPYST